LIDRVKVLDPAQHKIRNSPSQYLGLVWKNKTTKAHIHQSKQMYCNTK